MAKAREGIAMSNSVNIDGVRNKLDQQKRRFDSDQISENDYLESPAWPYNKYPSQLIELLQQSGGYAEYIRNRETTSEAADLKRNGDLNGANQKYMDITRNGTKLDKNHIWPWCKVLMMAKNFDDLKYLVEYLYSYNACYNRLCEKSGYNEVFAAYRQYGTEAPMGYSCDAGYYLRTLCESALATKDEIEWRFAQFGGSDLWSNYKLTDSEFESFKRNFGMPQPKPKPKPATASTTTSGTSTPSSSGGCYVATCVYGAYDCPEVWTLRRYRDGVLAKSIHGRCFIKTYYAISPRVVRVFGSIEGFRIFNKRILDAIVKHLRARGFESTPYNDPSR